MWRPGDIVAVTAAHNLIGTYIPWGAPLAEKERRLVCLVLAVGSHGYSQSTGFTWEVLLLFDGRPVRRCLSQRAVDKFEVLVAA